MLSILDSNVLLRCNRYGYEVMMTWDHMYRLDNYVPLSYTCIPFNICLKLTPISWDYFPLCSAHINVFQDEGKLSWELKVFDKICFAF